MACQLANSLDSTYLVLSDDYQSIMIKRFSILFCCVRCCRVRSAKPRLRHSSDRRRIPRSSLVIISCWDDCSVSTHGLSQYLLGYSACNIVSKVLLGLSVPVFNVRRRLLFWKRRIERYPGEIAARNEVVFGCCLYAILLGEGFTCRLRYPL